MTRMLAFPLTACLLLACAHGATTAAPASAPGAAPATLTAAERDAAVQDLEQTRRAFLASVQGLSDAQYRYKPAPDRWSIAEVAEHIALSEERIGGMITDKIMATKTPPELLAQVQHDDASISRLVRDRTTPRKAPEMLQPAGKFSSLAEATAAFTKDRDKMVAFVQNTKDDLRAHAGPHPLLKAMDAYQWVLLLSAHCARHTAQIEEVKADPKFPRS